MEKHLFAYLILIVYFHDILVVRSQSSLLSIVTVKDNKFKG